MRFTQGTAVVFLTLALAATGASLGAQQSHQLQEAIHLMETRGDYPAAIRLFQQVTEGSDRTLVAQALLYLGLCYERLDEEEALKVYQELIRKFPNETEPVEEARVRLAELARKSVSQTAPSMVARRLSENADFEVNQSAVFPDGRRFTTPVGETGDLAIYDLATREMRRITQKGSWDDSLDFAGHSVVSPDGKKVAYAWLDAATNRQELRIIGVDGSGERVLFHDEQVEQIRPDAWSRDGKRILAVMSSQNGTERIALIAVGDGSASILKTLDGPQPMETTLSADTRFVAYDFPQQEDSDIRDIFLLTVDSGEETRLISHPANDLWPTWTPDGSGILFYSNRTGDFGLWLLPVDDGAPRGSPVQVRREMGPAVPIGFTEDGSYYFALVSGSSDVYLASVDPRSGEVLEGPKLLDTGYTGWNLMPDWTTDGSCLVHISFRYELAVLPDSGRLIVSCVENGEMHRRRELRPALEFFRGVSWSPDGGSLIVMGRDLDKLWGIYAIDSESGEVTPLIQDPPDRSTVRHPEWTPDGEAFVYRRNTRVAGQDEAQILRRDLDSGREEVLYQVPKPLGLGGFALSPDGSHLVVTTSDRSDWTRSLKVVPLSGSGAATEIFKGSPEQVIYGPAWSPDGTAVWFPVGTFDLRKTAQLWRVFVENGEAEKLDLVEVGLRNLAIHPDGQRLAFISGTLGLPKEIWALENFLPSSQAPR